MSRQVEFEGKVHEFPDDATDAEVAEALGGAKTPEAPAAAPESALGKVGRIAGEELAKTPGRMVEGVKNLVSGGAEALQNPSLKTLLPLTVPGAGIATRLGTIAAGGMLDQPSESPAENIRTAVKSVTGYDLQKPPDWRQGLSTVLSPAAMEAILPAAGKAYRSTGWGRAAINASDARNVGQAAGEVAPTLTPGTTANAMQRTAEGQGLARIGAGKEAATQDVEGAVNAATGMRPNPGTIYVPSLGRAVTLREANDELSSIGAQMKGIKPLDPRFKPDIDLKQEYGRLAEEIKAGLTHVAGPDAAARWAQGQSEYRAGRFVGDDLLGRPTLFKQNEFNAQDLQRWLKNPENRADLARSLGGDLATGQNLGPYNQLVDAITRGAGAGMVDTIATKPLGLLESRGSWGMWAPVIRGANKLFSNAGSSYVGRVPFRPSPTTQSLADVIAAGAQR